MKNEKGFTLVELIVTIVLIMLSTAVIMVNMQGIESQQRISIYERKIKNIEEAACSAIDVLNAKNIFGISRDECKVDGCELSLKKLIEQGFIDEEETINDAGEKIKHYKNEIIVKIEWKDANGFQKKECTCTMYEKKCLQ